MYQITLSIDGMACSMCESHVCDTIRSKFSVKKVTASHSKGEAVILSETQIPEAELKAALLDKLPDSGTRGDNALNGVRCLGALYLGNLHELFEFLRALLQIQFLLPGFLVYGRNQTKNVRVPLLFPDCRVIEGSHSLTSILFPLNIRIK